MTHTEIAQLRLQSQHILELPDLNPDELIASLGAIQAQDYAGAKWSIGARISGVTDKTVEEYLDSQKIYRTWLMRGTLFFVAAKDIHWMLELFAKRIITSNSRRYKELELDTETLVKANQLIEDAFKNHEVLSRKDLLTLIDKNGISTKGQRAAYMLQRASYDGIICHTTLVKNTPMYVSLNKAPASTIKTKEESLVELAKRYFISRGPATLQDFAWWTGLPLADGKVGLEGAKPLLINEKMNGQDYWFSKKLTISRHEPSLFLLPGFDEFLLGYKDRIASIEPAHYEYWCPGKNGMFFPIMVLNGKVVGTWKKVLRKKSVSFEYLSFLKESQISGNDWADAQKQYNNFLGY